MSILWQGKPAFVPYLFSSKRFLWKLIGAVILVAYEKFQMLFLSKIAIAFLLSCIIYSLIQCKRLTYYITDSGTVVKKGPSCYLLQWKDLRIDEYRVYGEIVELLLGCRTFEFSRCYLTSGSKDAWREKARFWGVKRHCEVDRMVRSYLEERS